METKRRLFSGQRPVNPNVEPEPNLYHEMQGEHGTYVLTGLFSINPNVNTLLPAYPWPDDLDADGNFKGRVRE